MKRNLLLFVALFGFIFGYAASPAIFSADQISVIRLNLKTNGSGQSQNCIGLQCSTPELVVWNGFSANKSASFLFKMTNPNGKILATSSSPQGYTSQANVTLKPGENKVTLPSFSGCPSNLFVEGVYAFEVWCANIKVYQGNVEVTRQVTAEPEVALAPVEQPNVAPVEEQKPQQQVAVETPQPAVQQPENNNVVVAPQKPAEPVGNPQPQPQPKKTESMKFHFGITGGIVLPSTKVSANGVLSSVVDYGLTDIAELDMNENPNYVFGLGYSVGAFAQIPLIKGKNLFLEVGAQFAHYGYTNEFACTDVGITDYETFADYDYGIYGTYAFMDYANKETYSMNYVNIPVLVGYEFGITPLFRIDVKTGPVVGILASAKLNCEGHSNCEVYALDYYGDIDFEYGYSNSNTSGAANLLTGAYDFQQHYLTSDVSTDNINGNAVAAPFKPINASWRIGAGIGVGPVSIDLNYDLGLMNVGNAQYWENTNGERIPGLFYFGSYFSSSAPIRDYVQKFSSLSVGLSVRF